MLKQTICSSAGACRILVAGLLCLSTWPAPGQAEDAPKAVAPGASACFSILVPSYFYPSVAGSGWDTVIKSRPKAGHDARTLILNPNSGPGNAANADDQNIVKAAHRAGEKVYGYVATGYGSIPMQSAQEQVRKYIDWYGVDGIFVDEVSSEAAKVAYYQPLVSFVTSQIQGGDVVLNNGTYPDPSYAEINVPAASRLQIVVFEHDYGAFTDAAFADPAWTHKYPSSMFVNIVYGVSADEVGNVLQLSAKRNVGWVYATDEKLPNPYSVLPSYWNVLNDTAQAGCRR